MIPVGFKKSTYMRMLERLHPGRTIEQIVADACRRHDTPEGAAGELGVSRATLTNWRNLFGLEEGVEEHQSAGAAR